MENTQLPTFKFVDKGELSEVKKWGITLNARKVNVPSVFYAGDGTTYKMLGFRFKKCDDEHNEPALSLKDSFKWVPMKAVEEASSQTGWVLLHRWDLGTRMNIWLPSAKERAQGGTLFEKKFEILARQQEQIYALRSVWHRLEKACLSLKGKQNLSDIKGIFYRMKNLEIKNQSRLDWIVCIAFYYLANSLIILTGINQKLQMKVRMHFAQQFQSWSSTMNEKLWEENRVWLK